jgi:hypothetical protein
MSGRRLMPVNLFLAIVVDPVRCAPRSLAKITARDEISTASTSKLAALDGCVKPMVQERENIHVATLP